MCPADDEPNTNVVIYLAQKALPCESEADRQYQRLLEHFMTTENQKFRTNRFKMVPLCVKGPWMCKKALGSPALIGKKLETTYHVGEDYLEIAVDVGSSAIAKRVLGMVSGATKSLVIDLGFTIEGKTEQELPERLLGGCRFQCIDLNSLPKKNDAPTNEVTDNQI